MWTRSRSQFMPYCSISLHCLTLWFSPLVTGKTGENMGIETTPKAWSMKENLDKLDFIKTKNSALRKTALRKWKDKLQSGRTHLQNMYLIKGRRSKIYKELLNATVRNQPDWKWAEDLNRHLTKKICKCKISIWKDAQHHISLEKCKLKTNKQRDTSHHTPIWMVQTQNTASTKCWWGCGASGTLIQCWWECEMVQPLWKPFASFLQN